MMKSKILSVGLSSTVLAVGLLLNGCNSTPNAESQSVLDSVDDTATAADTISTDSDTNPEPSNESPEVFNTSYTILEPVTSEDESGIKFTLSDLTYENNEIVLSADIENNTDQNLSFRTPNVSVNGYMIDSGHINVDVGPGKKASDSVSISFDELSLYGINEVAEMQVELDVENEEYDTVYSDMLKVTTSLDETYDYDFDSYQEAIMSSDVTTKFGYTVDYYSDDILYDQSDIKIVSSVLLTNSMGNQNFFIEVENNSSDIIQAQTADIIVNGIDFSDGNWSTDKIFAGKRAILTFSVDYIIDSAFLEPLNITSINDFSFMLTILDNNDNDLVPEQGVELKIAENEVDTSGTELYNANGIRIINKGIVTDEYDDIHILLMIENNYSSEIIISDEYDSFSINDYMSDYIMYSEHIKANTYGLIDIQVPQSYLEDIGLSSADDILNAEIILDIEDSDYNTVDNPTLTMSFSDSE